MWKEVSILRTSLAMSYQNCSVGRYHDFTVVASPYSERKSTALLSPTQVERCKLCNETMSYTIEELNSRRYFLNHIRDFAQPDTDDKDMQAAFDYCKPQASQRLVNEAKERQASTDLQTELSDKFHWTMKRALNNQGWKDGDRSSSES